MGKIVATNTRAKVLHALATLTTECGLVSHRPATAAQLETARRCTTCFPDAAPAAKPATSKKPAKKVAPAKTPAAPVAPVDTTDDRKVGSWTYEIDAQQLEATEAKIAKINARADRRGLNGRMTMDVKPVEVTKTDELTGLEVTEIRYEVTLGGTAPAHNGFQFIATLDWDQHAGLIVRGVPGAAQVDRAPLKEGWCDHCRKNRRRGETYVVLDTNNGQQLQVGKSCIKDFTGWTGTVAFLETPSENDGGEGFFGPAGERDVAPVTVLAYAWAVIKLYGWVPSSRHWEGPTTKSSVMTALYPNPKNEKDKEFARTLRPLAKEAGTRAKEILDFIKSDAFAGDSDYVFNLKAVANGARTSTRNFGLLVSAPQAYARHLEKTLVREAAAKIGAASQWVGAEKERLEIEAVKIVGIRYIDGDYGVTTLYSLLDEATGNLFKWFATNGTLGEVEGARFHIKGTVKKHDEYQGTKSTVLTRVKPLAQLEDEDVLAAN